MTELASGTLINPSVRLVRHLGAGGMGSVWVADHLTLHTQVVVKFMAKELAKDAASVARFSREAAAASQVKSPHVVQTFDHGVVDGLPFIVMELLDGEDLAHRLQRTPRLPVEDVALIVSQVAKALTRAHERGVVHRDIKPDNIFLCDAGGGEIFVKVLDFGIAKRTEEHVSGHTATGQMVGTPVYMSPEQLTGSKEIDHRADLWSLGVVAYQALTGRRPFGGETVAALAIAIHTGDCSPPSSLNGALSPAVDEWFKRACAREPADRFTSAKEMAVALRVAAGTKLEESSTLAAEPTGRHTPPRTPESAYKLAMQKTQAAGSQTIPVAAQTIGGADRPPRPGWLVPAFVVGFGALAIGVLLLVNPFETHGSSAEPGSASAGTTTVSSQPASGAPVSVTTTMATTSTPPPPPAPASASVVPVIAGTPATTASIAPKKTMPSASASAKAKAVASTSVAKPGYDDDIE